jgi:protoheme IX farnesyltransferase
MAGLSILYFAVNPLTAFLGATTLFLYTLIYTPMKRLSALNTWVGSVVGAIPPVMGYTAMTGDITPGKQNEFIITGHMREWTFCYTKSV